jgi:hypothetical protein
MLESAACDHLRLAEIPSVGCDALVELKRVLRGALHTDGVQARHHSLNVATACFLIWPLIRVVSHEADLSVNEENSYGKCRMSLRIAGVAS